MADEPVRTLKTRLKDAVRPIVPAFFVQWYGTRRRLGPKAGQIYTVLSLNDALGIRGANQRIVPPSARSFLFVCYGNIMRSAMSEFFMRRALSQAGMEEQVQILSAGMHASPGREAHPWAQLAAAELGVSLEEHRAKLVTRELIEQADCVFAMDFQNKAELLTLYPDAKEKIYMLSAYAEGPSRYREISDPFLEDPEGARLCARKLQTCIRNLLASTIFSTPSVGSTEQPVAGR